MAEPFLAEIRMFGGNFAPRNWAFCGGQILSIAQNTALFSLVGTTYGGNGQTTFSLPNLNGRAPMGAGNGPGLTPRTLGETGGATTHTLTVTEMPSHTHAFSAVNAAGTSASPSGNRLAANRSLTPYATPAAATAMSAQSVTAAGGNQPHENRQPYLGVNFIIALAGVFPARN